MFPIGQYCVLPQNCREIRLSPRQGTFVRLAARVAESPAGGWGMVTRLDKMGLLLGSVLTEQINGFEALEKECI